MVGSDWIANGRVRNHFAWHVFKALGYLPVITTLGLMGGVEAVVMLRWVVDHHSLRVSTKIGTQLWSVGSAIVAAVSYRCFLILLWMPPLQCCTWLSQ